MAKFELAQSGERLRGIVFLDRDGTINIDTGYVTDPQCLSLIPGAAAAIGRLKAAGFRAVVVSNQSAIGRGIATYADVEATNLRLSALLKAECNEAELDAIFFCPHAPEACCGCRKPLPGLVLNEDFPWSYDIRQSWVIGDKITDLEFGIAVGLTPERCILVETGDGSAVSVEEVSGVEVSQRRLGTIVQPTIVEAADYIISKTTENENMSA